MTYLSKSDAHPGAMLVKKQGEIRARFLMAAPAAFQVAPGCWRLEKSCYTGRGKGL
jgi:hypothetical protein